jgi:tRNA nucleotidyltransferase (CCA-adding enzyme)
MLGRVPEDWDITTSATPLTVKELFPKTIDTGLQHGTVTVMMHGTGYEVTTYRVDGEYEDGRHPKSVSFTGNLKQDLERRDFTINAMAYNDSSGLVDIFDGVGDLQRKIIRCVGDAGQRFDEDALRMLRAVRFSGQLGFSIEEKTCQAIRERANHLDKISSERIRVELTKLLLSGGAEQIRVAYETGMTSVFLPEFDKMMSCDQHNHHHIYTVGEHSIQGICRMNDFFAHKEVKGLSGYVREKLFSVCDLLDKKQHGMLVLTMLLHDVAKPEMMTLDEKGVGHFYGHPEQGSRLARTILKRLTYDNDTVDTVQRLICYHDYRIQPQPKAVRRAASKIGKDIMWMEFLVQHSDVLSQNPDTIQEKLVILEQVMKLYEEMENASLPLCIKDLAINGNDLIQAGITPGPAIGQVLGQLLDMVLEEPECNTREQLLKRVKNIVL